MRFFVAPIASGLVLAFAFGACANLKEGVDPDSISSEGGSAPVVTRDAGSDGATGLSITTEVLATGRSRVGARSAEGFRPWRSGIVARGEKVYWVESGTAPGLYSVATTPCADPASCAVKEQTFTRPSAFSASRDHVFVADVNVVKRISFGDPKAAETVASHTTEVLNLAAVAAGTRFVWTAGTEPPIRFTDVGGATSSRFSSNGTPVAMAIGGGRVFWAGVDISGQLGALQSAPVDASGAREVSRFSEGFAAIGGNETYVYYAEGSPADIHRITVASGKDEVVDRDGLGVTDFALDATYAYWTERGDGPEYANGRVRRVAHDSKSAEEIAVAVAYPVALAVEGNAVYVASAGSPKASFADGKILKTTFGR